MMRIAILFVCTGNICRSPMAERMLLARARRGELVTASSAGSRALVGYGMDAAAARVLSEFGGDPVGHRARQLDAPLVEQADLILTGAAGHRSYVMNLDPLAMRRTFTMREFARLAAEAPPPRPGVHAAPALRDRIIEIAGRRGQTGPVVTGGDDIADPYGATISVMQACGRQISEAVDAILRGLGLGGH